MAARLWGGLILLQLAMAILIAIAIVMAVGGGTIDAWTASALPVVAFVVVQYLITALTIVISRALAGEPLLQRLVPTLQVALSEPICFGMAQLSMVLARDVADGADVVVGADVVGGADDAGGADVGGRARDRDAAPLLLVHGLACNRGIWRWLIPRLHAAGFASIHALDLQPLRGDLDGQAGQVVREVRRLHRAHGGAGVTIIGHSMGGLIARAALRIAAPQTIRRIITIGTPHHGAAIARVLGWRPAEQMRLGSPWLAALNASQERQPPVELTSIYSLDDNLVAPALSAKMHGAVTEEIHGLGHFGLLVSRRALDCVVHALEGAT